MLLTTSQVKMKQRYDKKAVAWSFQPGDQDLFLLFILGSAMATLMEDGIDDIGPATYVAKLH